MPRTPIEMIAGLDFLDVADTDRIGPVPRSYVLREEFMRPLGLSARALMREVQVPTTRVAAILSGQCGASAKTNLLPGERFGASVEFWLSLQMMHDLEEARRHRQRTA